MSREGERPYAMASKRRHETPAEIDSPVPSKRIRIDTDPETAETACAIQIASGSSPPKHAEPEHLKRDESSLTKGNAPLEEDNRIETPAEERPREDEPDATQSHDIPKKVDQTDEAPEKEEVSKILTSDISEKEVPILRTHDASEKEVPEIPTHVAPEMKVFETSPRSISVKRGFCSTPTSDASERAEVSGSSTFDISEIITWIGEASEAETDISATHSCDTYEMAELSATSNSDAAEVEVSASAVVDMEVSEAQSSDTIDMDVSLTQSSGAQSMDISVTPPSEVVAMDSSVTLRDAPEKENIEISSPVKNILDETPHTSKVEMSELIRPATEKKINDEIECQLKKEIRELGENYDAIFTLLKDVRGPLEVKKTFVELAIKEASRFERKELIKQLQSFLKKCLTSTKRKRDELL